MKNWLHTENEKVGFRMNNLEYLSEIYFCVESEAAEKRRKEKEEHSVEAYESKFKQIQEISHEQDLDKLVDKFIEGLILNLFDSSVDFSL